MYFPEATGTDVTAAREEGMQGGRVDAAGELENGARVVVAEGEENEAFIDAEKGNVSCCGRSGAVVDKAAAVKTRKRKRKKQEAAHGSVNPVRVWSLVDSDEV
ncbi:hypothetical protein HPP92_005822 [Vanilla planifolia]|uniref:Uncharacterized protein n=1 Tax=Vanilla planifolia TaxID=51239 RepID=A0A835RJ89_VANPL|nr:hypothetical protein HPP92_005822 [Vanilla planifolia]